jgi:myo-inositol-1(or 4)-monophosphatase
MQPKLKDLQIFALQAGAILRAAYGQEHKVHYKGLVDPVTEVDRQSEVFLLGQIRERFADHTIITEESGHLQGTNSHCWYIDPLDGTVNYSHGVPMFSVSIAYAEGGRMQMGVVYDPLRDELFSAARGEGAQLNGDPIHVSDTTELIRTLLATGFPYDIPGRTKNLVEYSKLSMLTQGVRRLGSAALDLSYVACGRLDGFWEMELGAWDLAAGTLILEEAGGIATDLRGSVDYMRPPFGVVGANPAIHPLLLKELANE